MNGEEIYDYVAQEKEYFIQENLRPRYLVIDERKMREIIELPEGYALEDEGIETFLGLEIVRSLNDVIEVCY